MRAALALLALFALVVLSRRAQLAAGEGASVSVFDAAQSWAGGLVGTPLDEIYQRWGVAFGVDWRLIKAHAIVESSENPAAYNTEGSSGLMQILLPLSRNRGALRHFNAGRLPEWGGVDAARDGLIFDSDYNVKLGAALIRENIALYGLPKAIAVYNRDAERNAPTAGPFANQGYVDKVLRQARALGWSQ